MYDIIIIGGGVSGMGAAIYAARFNLKTLILTERIGGLIQDTHLVENYPGIKSITGIGLVNKFIEHIKDYKNITIIENKVTKIKNSASQFTIIDNNNNKYESQTVIYATGTTRKKLNVKGEKEFMNKGISYCAICDAALFKNKNVCVIGGSDSAAKEALLLSKHAKKVYIIYRGEQIRAEPINLKRITEDKKIEIINNTNITEVSGSKFVEKVTLDKPYKDKKELKLDGVFIEIGHLVFSELAKEIGIKTNKNNEIIINKKSETNIKGFYAAGDVTNTDFKQAITGVAEGCTAAYSAYNYIQKSRQP